VSVDGSQATAVVLVGGASTRMGRDKALLVPPDGDPRPLARRVLDALLSVADNAVLAGRPLAGFDVPAVSDHNVGAGPLAGVAAALAAVGTPLAVVAACDMPSLQPALLRLLLRRAQDEPDALCVVCMGPRGMEPLLAVWRPAAAPLLDAALGRGVRALRDAVAAVPHVLVAPEHWRAADPTGLSFVNWNTPADLRPS
jgi:molybdopterin-guanine dinucleotide biosynthesis protein A